MAQGKPYQAYQTTGIKTSGQKQLIVMLYEGMHRFMNRAVKAIEAEDYETAHNYLNRTGKILLELLSTLREDKGGEIAANLKRLYVYCYEKIVIANLKKDIELICEVQKITSNLGSAWKQISAKQGANLFKEEQPQRIQVMG